MKRRKYPPRIMPRRVDEIFRTKHSNGNMGTVWGATLLRAVYMKCVSTEEASLEFGLGWHRANRAMGRITPVMYASLSQEVQSAH